MFEQYFGFSKTPFSKDIPPSAIFTHDSLTEALARLSYAVERKLICALTNPTVGARGILSDIVANLAESPCFLKSKLIRQAKEVISAETKRGKTIVLTVDEAHLLNADSLEEIRLLTNFDMDSSPKFSLILSGQPSLAKKLKFYTLAALEQRIAIRVRLLPLNLSETAGYIKHHLSFCGRSDNLFSDDAVSLIHKTSGGIPRIINNLSIQALMAGYSERKSIIDEATVKRAVAEIQSE